MQKIVRNKGVWIGLLLVLLMAGAAGFVLTPYTESIAWNADTTWLCLGDSITLGECNHNISYADYACKMTGIHLLKQGYSGYTVDMLSNAIEELPEDVNPDVITVMIGTNDWVYSIPLGTQGDEVATFYGELRRLIALLLERFPDSRICFFTPIYRDMQENPAIPFTGTVNMNGNTVEEYADGIRSCCEDNDLAILDLYHTSGITADNIHAMTVDGTHPNILGHLKIAYLTFKQIHCMLEKNN